MLPHQPQPQQQMLPDGMDIPAQVLDEALLSDRHEWSLIPDSGFSFRAVVEEDMEPRADIAQYKLIAGENRTIARNLFSLMCRSPTLFRVPCSLVADRTFARDKEEAYYLDAMDKYLSQPPGELNVSSIPLLQRPLKNRLFNSFSRKAGYRLEYFERLRLAIWVPYDVPENRHFGDAELSANYPKIEEWVKLLYLPPALAVPVPFVIYYFYKELRRAQLEPYRANTERIRRLLFCLRKEYHVLFMAMWWNEVYFGGRMYVLEEATINALQTECGTVPDIAGMPAQAILAHMRMVSATPEGHHNWMCFQDGCMEPSAFVWGVKGVGGLDTTQPVRTRYFCRKAEKRLSTRKYGAPIWRRRSVMEERLSIPDLDKIEGLLGLVDDYEWQAHGSLRVSDMLHHLLSLYRRTRSRVTEEERAFAEVRRHLSYAREDLRVEGRKLQDSRDRADFLESCLRARDKRIEDMETRLLNQERELRHLRAQAKTLRNVQSPSNAMRPPQTPERSRQHAEGESRTPSYNPPGNSGELFSCPKNSYTGLRKPYIPVIGDATQQSRPSTKAIISNPYVYPQNSALKSGVSSQPVVSRPSTPGAHCDLNRATHVGTSRRPRVGYPFYPIPSTAKRQKLSNEPNDNTT